MTVWKSTIGSPSKSTSPQESELNLWNQWHRILKTNPKMKTLIETKHLQKTEEAICVSPKRNAYLSLSFLGLCLLIPWFLELSLLNNYGSISLRESENIETNAKALSEFITKKHSYIDFIEIEKTYKEYTPNCVAKKFLSVIKDREKLDVFK